MQCLNVDLADRSYPIYIGAGLMAQPELLTRHISGRQVCIVTDDTVAPLYLDALRSLLADYRSPLWCCQLAKPNKNWATLQQIFDVLLAGAA